MRTWSPDNLSCELKDTGLFHGTTHHVAITLRQRRQRQAQAGRDQTHFTQGPFDRDGVGLDEQRLVQAGKTRINGRGLVGAAGERRRAHGVHGARRNVGSHRDHALAAEQNEFARRGVVASIDIQTLAAALQNVAGTIEIAGGVLDADDIGNRRQPLHRLGQYVTGGAARHVVEYLRYGHRLGDGLVVQIKAFLSRLVVIRRYQQARIGPTFLGEASEFDGFTGGIGTGAGDHRHAATREFHHLADDLAVFVGVEALVRVHGRDEGHHTTVKHREASPYREWAWYWPHRALTSRAGACSYHVASAVS